MHWRRTTRIPALRHTEKWQLQKWQSWKPPKAGQDNLRRLQMWKHYRGANIFQYFFRKPYCHWNADSITGYGSKHHAFISLARPLGIIRPDCPQKSSPEENWDGKPSYHSHQKKSLKPQKQQIKGVGHTGTLPRVIASPSSPPYQSGSGSWCDRARKAIKRNPPPANKNYTSNCPQHLQTALCSVVTSLKVSEQWGKADTPPEGKGLPCGVTATIPKLDKAGPFQA